MSSQLFQQILSVVKEVQGDSDLSDITTYEILIDEIFNEVEHNIKFFAHRFDQLLAMFYQLLQTYQAQGTSLPICSNFFEVFVVLVERRPVLIEKNGNRLMTMVQQLYEMFNKVDFQYDQMWMKPFDGYVEENDFSQDQTLSKQIMSYFDRIASTYTYPLFNEFFSQILSSWWANSENNWKARYALLMIMSQFGENVQFPLTMKPFIECAKNSIHHEHPKVRYAALQMLGQLSDDMKPDFQQFYGPQFLPIILGCTKDQIPRVQGHAMAALTNFLQDFQTQNNHILQPYIDQIINVAENFCSNGISLIKENTISSLASLTTSDILTPQQVQRILNIIHHLLTSDQHKGQEYTQLMKQTIECLSMLLYGQSKDKVEKFLGQSVNIIKSYKEIVAGEYLINAWSRLCLKYKNFTELSDIFPFILEQVFSMIANYESQVTDAIRAINNTITAFKETIKPYTGNIFEFCKNSIAKLSPEDAELRSELYDIFVALVTKLKSEAPDPQYDAMAKEIFQFLFQESMSIVNQHDDGSNEFLGLQESLSSLQKCVNYVDTLFTGENATKFAESIFNFTTRITELIRQSRAQMEEDRQKLQEITDDIDQEEMKELIELTEQKINKLYEARLAIPDIFESVLAIIPRENSKAIIESLYPHISEFLQNTLPFQDIRYGIYFLCDFMTSVKYEGIQDHAQVYESKFCQFSLSPNLQVRNCAVFGLGEFMSLIPAEKTDENMIYKWLNLLWNSLSLTVENNSDKKKFNFARDNIVSALGKLIQSKRSYYPVALNQEVHKKWFENLPLNHDKTEGNIQHEILLTLLDQTPELFISTKDDIYTLLMIFAKYFTKRINKTDDLIVKNKIATKQYLFKMKDWPIFQENSEFLWSNLPANHKSILTQLTSAP